MLPSVSAPPSTPIVPRAIVNRVFEKSFAATKALRIAASPLSEELCEDFSEMIGILRSAIVGEGLIGEKEHDNREGYICCNSV